MPKMAAMLSAKQVGALRRDARVGGVPGLELRFGPDASRSWVLTYSFAGRRPEMGLGGYPEVGLAEARERARKARESVRQGIDPVHERKAARSAAQAARLANRTFKQCAVAYIDAKGDEFKNRKHLAQWSSTLETYAFPHIGNMLVRDIDVPHVRACLDPIWQTKTETASRLRGRIEAVLDWATVSKYRAGDNPARWRGNLDILLARPSKIAKVVHQRAVPFVQIGDFMADLRKVKGQGAAALELLTLTAARSGEIRGATWAEIDLATNVWTIPGARMKMGKEHRVPLSGAARALLDAIPRREGVDLLFAAPKGGPLSDMTISAVMRRMGVDAVPHGMRATFRTWAGDIANFPHEICEAALAHAVGAVEGAYSRGDLLDKRRALMEEWATFCATPSPKAAP